MRGSINPEGTVRGTTLAFVPFSTRILFPHCPVTGPARKSRFCGIFQTRQRPNKESESIERNSPVFHKVLWQHLFFILRCTFATHRRNRAPAIRSDGTLVPRRNWTRRIAGAR